MGFDKATTVVDGVMLAVRTAQVLGSATAPVVEVGPGVSGVALVTAEEPAGAGPLAAIVAGARLLRREGHDGSVVVVACDLPLLDPALVSLLVAHPSPSSVVPMAEGRAQPLCARWAQHHLTLAEQLLHHGERSLRTLLGQPDVVLMDEAEWRAVAPAAALRDVDTTADLERTGLPWRAGHPSGTPGAGDGPTPARSSGVSPG